MDLSNITEPSEIAQSLKQRLSDAVGDLAFENESYPSRIFLKWKAKAREEGVQDFIGAYADHLYNDVGCAEMMADWMYDYTEDPVQQIAVYKELINIGHTSIVTFAEQQIHCLQKRMAKA